VRQAAWGVLTPIDRGEHGIVVTAPGKREYKTSIDVKEDGTTQRVSIPALEDLPVVIDRTRGSGTEHPPRGQLIVGWVTTAVGVAVLGVGIGTGVAALDAKQRSDKLCSYPGGTCGPDGIAANDDAKTFAWLSDFGIGIGAAAIIGGIVLVLTSPKAPVHVVPTIISGATTSGAGAMLFARF